MTLVPSRSLCRSQLCCDHLEEREVSALGSRKCWGGGGPAWSKGRKEEEARVDGHHILPPVYLHTHTQSLDTEYCHQCICRHTPTLLGHHILPPVYYMHTHTHTHTHSLGHHIYCHYTVYTHSFGTPYTATRSNAHTVYNMQYIPIYTMCITHTCISLRRTQCHHERSLTLYCQQSPMTPT